jgi:hypothetical protein
MVDKKHTNTPEIEETLDKVNKQWKDLSALSQDKGERLRQAAQQELFNKALQDAEAKVDELEKMLKSDDVGKDLHSVKDLLLKQQVALIQRFIILTCDTLVI